MRDSDLFVDLRALPLRGGEHVHRIIDLEIEPLYLGGLRYDVVLDGGADLVVSKVSGGYLVKLSLRATVHGPCFRCLKDVALPVDAVQEEFVPQAAGWSQEDVSPFIEEFVVDVSALAREVVILALPPKVLCREACPGMCPSCGEELSQCRCSHGEEQGDPRWDVLRRLQAASADVPASEPPDTGVPPPEPSASAPRGSVSSDSRPPDDGPA
jgi:uncharacterized protein